MPKTGQLAEEAAGAQLVGTIPGGGHIGLGDGAGALGDLDGHQIVDPVGPQIPHHGPILPEGALGEGLGRRDFLHVGDLGLGDQAGVMGIRQGAPHRQNAQQDRQHFPHDTPPLPVQSRGRAIARLRQAPGSLPELGCAFMTPAMATQ